MTEFDTEIRSTLWRQMSGSASEDERLEFEQRLLSDQDFSDEAAACEQTLIDDYARGRLLPHEEATIAPWIGASARRRQRLEIARALPAALSRTARQRSFFSVGHIIPFGLAACALIAFGLMTRGAFSRRTAGPGNGDAVAVNSSSARTKKSTGAANTSQRREDVILLAAERLRGPQKLLTYPLHRDAPTLIQVLLPGHTQLGVYSVRVVAQAGARTMTDRSGVMAERSGHAVYVEVSLPAGSLPPGTYVVTIQDREQAISTPFDVVWAKE